MKTEEELIFAMAGTIVEFAEDMEYTIDINGEGDKEDIHEITIDLLNRQIRVK